MCLGLVQRTTPSQPLCYPRRPPCGDVAGSRGVAGTNDLKQNARPGFRARRDGGHDPLVGRELRAGGDCAAGGGDRREQRVPARPLAAAGRSRASGYHRGRGGRRQRAWLSGALRRHGGGEPGVGLGRAQLRRALQPLRQPDQAERHTRAARALPAQADLGRACRRARHERAGRGLGRGGDAHAGDTQGRSLRPQRVQDVDHQRAGRRGPRGLRQDRPGRRQPGHHRLPHREGHGRLLHRPKTRQARHARLKHLRIGVRGLRGAGGERDRRAGRQAWAC